jgi:hypothetical protein
MSDVGVLRELAAAAWASGHLAEDHPMPPTNLSGGLDGDLSGCGARIAGKLGVYSKAWFRGLEERGCAVLR